MFKKYVQCLKVLPYLSRYRELEVNRRAIVVFYQQFEKSTLSVLEKYVTGSLLHLTEVASFSTGSALSPRELHSLEF